MKHLPALQFLRAGGVHAVEISQFIGPRSSEPEDADPLASGPKGIVRVGDRVRVRRQRWTVVHAQQYDGCQLLTLSALDARTERHVLTPFDRVEPLEAPARARFVTLRRWRHAYRSLLVQEGPAGILRSAARARIDLLPHQLEPAIALMRGLGSRVLLADEVGLGKTIQAGLAISELKHCGAAERMLVLSPAGLREQWAEELAARFGLDPAIVDASDTRRRAARLPIGLNPWSTVPLAIASIDYVKRPEVLPAVTACRWDIVVVDEAHGVTSGSDRHAAASTLCGRAPYVLLLTATPHSGDHRAFLSLCNLGARDHDPLLLFRRSRREVALGAGRRARRLMVRPSPEERRMHQLLARFTRAVRADRGDRDRDSALALSVLHKRAFSSPHSLEQSVLRRLSTLESAGRLDTEQQLLLPLDDSAGDLDSADQPPMLGAPLLIDAEHERHQLLLLAEAARAATARETKLARLVRLVNRLRRRQERAIVFTEYRDTLLHVERALPGDAAVLHGGLTRAERRAALDDFRGGRRSILLATDAAGEGLNLQDGCRVVITLELPWNPTRLEQRIGRVDRIGQQRTVHAVHLVARDTGEVRILERLRERVAQARADLGAPDSLAGITAPVESEDYATARLVLYDDDSRNAEQPPCNLEDGAISPVRLAREADAERQRLAHQRSFTADAIPATGDRQLLLSRTRRRAARVLLGRYTLVLVQTECEDARGRLIAAHVTPLVLGAALPAASSGVPGLSRVRSEWTRWVEVLPLRDMDPSLTGWEQETQNIHRKFWTRRLARERAIGRALFEGAVDPFQPGLFDRRADRERRHVDREESALQENLAHRISMLESASSATIRPARAALVLMSRYRP